MRLLPRVLLSVSVASCIPAATATYGTVPRAELALNGIALGATDAEVKTALGTPRAIHDQAEPGRQDPTVLWEFDNLDVGLRSNRVVTLSCYRQACRTPAGIAVGDSATVIDAVYGRTVTVYADNTLGTTVYRVAGSSNCAMRIERDLGVVIGFQVGCNVRF
jgi:hypothetical protein